MGAKIDRGYRLLDQRTIEQRNRYYGAVVAFEKRMLQNAIDAKMEEGMSSRQKSNLAYQKKSALKTMEQIHIETLRWLQSAKEYYDSKLLQAAKKLLEFGALESSIVMMNCRMEENHSRGFDFYIPMWHKKRKKIIATVHARLVWVECTEKASHWRFVCTKKKAN